MTHTFIPDTDSIHMLKMPEEEIKQFVDIDDYCLGKWKIESCYRRGKYIRSKCYIEENDEEELNVTVAGLPKNLGKYVTFENFDIGFALLAEDKEIDHKLTFKHVNGGVLLVDDNFTIKKKCDICKLGGINGSKRNN